MKSTAVIPAILICLLLYGNTFSQKIDKDALPPDYNCSGCVLVIIKKEQKDNIRNINDMIEKHLIKEYEGKSVFITAKELGADSLYKDTTVFRFVLDHSLYNVVEKTLIDKGNGRTGWMTSNLSALNMQIYDRLTRKGYGQLSNWRTWPKNMEMIAKALNKLLKKE